MKKFLFAFMVFIMVMVSVLPAAFGEVLPRDLKIYSVNGITYYMFVPREVNADTPIFVSVHGVSRNADEHGSYYVPYAKERGVISIAPLLPEETYPNYQTLGQDSDQALNKIIEHAKSITGSEDDKISLSGSSGGAQFAHRYMMKYPYKVERLAVSAANYYTFPDPTYNYAQGLRYSGFNPNEFLKVPAMVIVGELDNETEGTYSRDLSITAQQGEGRHERGKNWITSMRGSAQAKGLSTTYQFESLPGVGHDFGAKDMCERIFNFLFPRTASVEYGPNIIGNGSFETGNITNWYEWMPRGQRSKQRVYATDPLDGEYKVDFYSASKYQQSIHQVLSRIDNGKYEVSAYVKQSGPSLPPISRMEVYKYGGSQINIDIDHVNIYHKISKVVDVTTGELGVGFYVYSNGGTRLKIDKVEVKKILNAA